MFLFLNITWGKSRQVSYSSRFSFIVSLPLSPLKYSSICRKSDGWVFIQYSAMGLVTCASAYTKLTFCIVTEEKLNRHPLNLCPLLWDKCPSRANKAQSGLKTANQQSKLSNTFIFNVTTECTLCLSFQGRTSRVWWQQKASSEPERKNGVHICWGGEQVQSQRQALLFLPKCLHETISKEMSST